MRPCLGSVPAGLRSRFVVLASLLLAACGGADDLPKTAVPLVALTALAATPCASTGTVVRIQLFGDSTQAGFVGLVRAANTPAVALQADLWSVFGPGSVVVEDRAVANTSAAQLLDGSDGLNKPWPASVDAHIVVVNHGINDRGQGVSDVDYWAELERLAVAPARVVFETPSPLRDDDLESYAQVMRQVAAIHAIPLADTFAYVRGLPAWQLDLVDRAHPSEDLYAHIVRFSVLPAVTPLVRSLRCR